MMSVRMLSRPSSSSTTSTQQQPLQESSAALSSPTSPPLLPNSFSSSTIPLSPGSSSTPAAASPSARLTPSPSLLFEEATPAVASTDASRIVLPSPYYQEGGDFNLTDPLTKQVVVVGVVSRLECEASQLLDRILLAQVFSVSRCASKLNTVGDEGDNAIPRNHHQQGVGTERPHPQHDNGIGKGGRSHQSKGKGKSDESARNRDASIQRDHHKLGYQDGGVGSQSDSVHVPKEKTGNKIVGDGNGNGRDRSWIDGKIKNYYDREKGVLYVQYVWGSLPHDCMREEKKTPGERLAEAMERHEADSLRGLLFMFSVCHILLIVQEGSRFDPRYLRMFRTLQTAKYALAPFVKTEVLPVVIPQPISRPSQSLRSGAVSRDATGRSGVGFTGPQSSSMSGSVPVLYPGQCTPVTLFVCLEESTDSGSGCGPSGSAEDSTESSGTSSSLQIWTGTNSPGITQSRPSRSSQSTVGSNRSGSKTEAGLRKKMQASTEAQIRFLLKKCRTLASVAGEGGSTGSVAAGGIGLRGLGGGANTFGGAGTGGALFALDQSRAVVFVDRASNRPGAGLEEISDGLARYTRNMEGSSTCAFNLAGLTEPVADDIQAIKDFLLRHTDILRGKGPTASTTTGSSGGAGMVAAAAAAAAASASGGASGATKPLHNPPDLPTVTAWFSACQILVEALTSAWENRDNIKAESAISEKNDNLKVQNSSPRKGVRRYSQISLGVTNVNPTVGTSNLSMVSQQRGASLDGLVSTLDSTIDIDHKFSTTWCKRSIPLALEVYLKDLPSMYPTVVHIAHLERALVVFHSMVRGPAVPLFVEKLTTSCEAIWHAGRQLCDAVSLTGKPCRHLVHDGVKPISHAMAEVCRTGGQAETRAQKGDTTDGVIKEHSSRVVFLHACACGRSRKLRKDPFTYESANVTFFQFPNCENMIPSLSLPASSSDKLLGGSSWSLVRLGSAQYYRPGSGLMQVGFIPEQNKLSLWDILVSYESSDTAAGPTRKTDIAPETYEAAVGPQYSIQTPKGFLPRPQNGSVPHKQGQHIENFFNSKVVEKEPSNDNYKLSSRTSISRLENIKATTSSSSNVNYGGDSAFPPLPQKIKKLQPTTLSKPIKSTGEISNGALVDNMQEEAYPGSQTNMLKNTVVEDNLVFMTPDASKEHKDVIQDSLLVDPNKPLRTQHFQVYVGFEHECPRGHRFLLSADHVQSLGISQPLPIAVDSDLDAVMRTDSREGVMNDQHLVMPKASGATFMEKKTKEGTDVMRILKSSGEGLSLLGMNIPIFMQCPHCEGSKSGMEMPDGMVYAGCISQLQRIFLVTPQSPLILATRAVVGFEEGGKQEHMDGCSAPEVVLPPDSFLVLRLPFVYHNVEKNGTLAPLSYREDAPERTPWLIKGTALRVPSRTPGGFGVFTYRYLSDLHAIQMLRSTLEYCVGTSATLGGIKDVTSFVPSLLWFAEMYYVEEFLCIKQSKSSVGLWLTLYTTMEWLGTDSAISYVKYFLAHLRRVAGQHLYKYQEIHDGHSTRKQFGKGLVSECGLQDSGHLVHVL